MAKTTVVHVTDDLDGSKDATEIAFTFGGVDYTIDLSKKNAAAMEKALRPYVEAATQVPARPRAAKSANSANSKRRSRSGSSSRKDYSVIREWARGQGIKVSDRGRVPAAVIEQYEAAQQGAGRDTR